MSLLKLRLSILGTLALIIGLSTLFFTVILTLLGVGLVAIAFLVIIFNVIQWLIAPYLIDFMYRVREAPKSESPKLHEMVERLSQKSGIKKPKVMIANIPMPNAFAYGSPLTGSKVAVTSSLLETLEAEEVEAVIGHELGHLKHRDVQVMMFVSVLPALAFYIGYSLILSSMYRGREERSSGAAVVGFASIILYWILTLFVLQLSRLREYYADRHSVSVVDDGARKLSEGLAKIVSHSSRTRDARPETKTFSSFKSLFIADPDHAASDTVELAQMRGFTADQKLVQAVLTRKITTADKIIEAFSTHPNIVKRLRAILEAR